ncbi:hypothetical protein AB2B38_000885 [Balneola sp. MJW-20]|uniref:hypothetical protein n=1 Tax=Gracilimonas aurantiaca TaxID=3234185 RepID=UPI0034671041
MNYQLQKKGPVIAVSVEASFTLIDFLVFFTAFFLGFVFAGFFLIFAFAVIQKIFSRYDFVFDLDRYSVTRFYSFFSYFRFRREERSFSDITEILLSDHDSGKVLFGKGMSEKVWYTLDIMGNTGFSRIAQVEEDDLEVLYELFEDLSDELDIFLRFRTDFNSQSHFNTE